MLFILITEALILSLVYITNVILKIMCISFEWRSKGVHQPAQRGAEGLSDNVTPSVGPLPAIGARNRFLQKRWVAVSKC